MVTMPAMTASIASGRAMPFCSSQNSGGALMMARNSDSKNGTSMASAARMPATTTTKAAAATNSGTARVDSVVSPMSVPGLLPVWRILPISCDNTSKEAHRAGARSTLTGMGSIWR